MIKKLILFIFIILNFSILSSSIVYANNILIEGAGTKEDPYLITNESHLIAIANNELSQSGYYILKNDIVLNTGEWKPINFYGNFDGNGHIISNIKINTNKYKNNGLFGLNKGTIKQLGVNGNISSGSTIAGILAGSNEGNILYCYSSGTVCANKKVGGLVGYNEDGKIINCYSNAKVKGKVSTGGLIGECFYGYIGYCYSAGYVNSSSKKSGGLLGFNKYGHALIKFSYYDKNTSKKSDTKKGIPLETAKMKSLKSYIQWDFNNVWEINTTKNNGYPFLLSNIKDTSNEKNAIIIIGGITGSELSTYEDIKVDNKKVDKDTLLWLDINFNIVNYVKMLECNSEGNSIYAIAEKKIKISDRDFGTLGTYTNLVEKVRESCSESYDDINFFGYDWRLSIKDAGDKLQEYINNNNYSKVTLVCHSMGGLVACEYISKSITNRNKIDKLITLGTPYLGAPKALNTLESGEFLGGVGDLITKGIFKDLSQNMSAVYELLPSKKYVEQSKYIVEEVGSLFNRQKREYDYDETSKFIKSRRNSYLTQNAEKVHISLFNNNSHITDLVDTYVIVGTNQPTISNINVKMDKKGKIKKVYDLTPKRIGDGTVPLISATIGKKTETGINKNKIISVELTHGKLATNNLVIDCVTNIINGQEIKLKSINNNVQIFSNNISKQNIKVFSDNEDVNFSFIKEEDFDEENKSMTINSENTTKIRLEGDMELYISDKDNNLIGYITKDKISANYTYENCFYSIGENNNIKLAFLPLDDYKVELKAISNGSADYSIEEYKNSEFIEASYINNIEVSENMYITSNTKVEEGIIANIDKNGDNVFDCKIKAKLVKDKDIISEQKVIYNDENLQVNDKLNEQEIIKKPKKLRYILNGNNTVTIKWKKQNATGYEIRYSTKKKFSNYIKVRTKKPKYKINKLKIGKKYYIKVRTYKKINGKKYYSKFSNVIKIDNL